MTENIYISRNYVEFGAFTPDEILAFEKRGILLDIDHVRAENAEVWLPLNVWLAETTKVKPAAKKPAAKKAPAKKRAVAKKAA